MKLSEIQVSYHTHKIAPQVKTSEDAYQILEKKLGYGHHPAPRTV